MTIAATMAIGASAQPVHTMSKPSGNARVEIITEQPEGTVVSYSRSGEYMTVSLYGYEATQQTGQMKITYAPTARRCICSTRWPTARAPVCG